MKIVLLCLILVCFVYFGVQIKNSLKTKKAFYNDLIEFCENYKREINFLKCDLQTIITKCTKNGSVLNNVLNDFLSKKTMSVNFLSNEEQGELLNFFNSLGKQDIDGELNNIDFYVVKFKQNLGKHTNNFNKYGEFSVKMSAVLGVLVCILLI